MTSLSHPTRTLLRTWRNMAIAALLMGGFLGFAVAATGTTPPWYGFPLLSLACLMGPCCLPLAGRGGLNTATFRLSICFEVSRGAKGILAV